MRKLLIFVSGFATAVGLLVYFFGGAKYILILPAACLAVPLFFCRQMWLRCIAVFALGLALGFAWCSVYTDVLLHPADTVCGGETSFSAVAVEYSSPTRFGNAVTADLQINGRSIRANLYYSGDTQIAPGDTISGKAEFERTPMLRTDADGFYSISRGVYLTGNVIDEIIVHPELNPAPMNRLRRFSQKLKENIYRTFPEDSAGYFAALATGDRSGMSYAFRNRLSVVGLYHAVSLSGMHVSVLMSTLILFCLRHKRLAAILGIPLMILFSLMSGASPATLRAVCMQIVLLLTLFVDREYDPMTSLSLALFLLLLGNPWSLTHWGLQLSFASSAGILLLMPYFMRLQVRSKILRILLAPVFVTLSATVFSAPLISAYFGLNSLIAPLTNLLALWSVTVSFVGSIVIALLGFVSIPAAQLLANGFDCLYRFLYWVVSVFSQLPFAAVYKDTPLLLAWSYLAYLLVVTGLLLRVKWFVPALCVLSTLVVAICFTPRNTDGITVLDVGQGQCIVLHSKGSTVLVDCGGGGSDTGETAARHLLSRGIRKLDAVVVTHFDADHCDGVLQLLDRMDADALYCPETEETAPIQEEILSAAPCAIRPVTNITALSLPDMEVTVYPALDGKNDNDTGVCVLASCRECDILITGDLRAAAESKFVTAYDLPDLEVLVAGHHGSEESTGAALLERLYPETVLISVGRNPFGHPSQETLDRIATTGAVAYTTMDNGNLTIGW